MKWIKSGEANEADLNKELNEYNSLMTSIASLSKSFISEIGKAKDADLDKLEAIWDTYWQKVSVATQNANAVEKKVYSEASAFKKKAQAAYDKAKDIAYEKQKKKDKKEKESSILNWNKKTAAPILETLVENILKTSNSMFGDHKTLLQGIEKAKTKEELKHVRGMIDEFAMAFPEAFGDYVSKIQKIYLDDYTKLYQELKDKTMKKAKEIDKG